MGKRVTVALALLLIAVGLGGSACKKRSAYEEPQKVAAASPAERQDEEKREAPTEPSAAAPAESENRPMSGTELLPGGDEPAAPVPAAQRMVVYHAWLRLAVHALAETLAAIDAVAVRQGGYVDSGTLAQRVLRIPVANYRAAVDELKALGEVRDFRQSSWDVTEKYQNIEARIDNLRVLRQRYLVLLAQAATMDERLAVEKELRRIELELRVLEEERRMLADEAAFATITVDVEAIRVQPVVRDRRPQPFGWVRGYGLERLLAR